MSEIITTKVTWNEEAIKAFYQSVYKQGMSGEDPLALFMEEDVASFATYSLVE